MNIQAQIDENGMVKITDPELQGKDIFLQTSEWKESEIEEKTNWDALWKIFKEADQLQIPRRSNEEILRDLHEFRG